MGMNAKEYLMQLQALLPRGAAWPRGEAAVLTRTLLAKAEEYARVDERASSLVKELFPSLVNEMLPEYEGEYGLPLDPANAPATVQGRVAALVAQVQATGGASVPYFVNLAARLGYTVTIDENVDGNPFLWRVNVSGVPTYEFRAGESEAGDLLLDWDAQSTLEGIFQLLKQAHHRVIFSYA